MILPYSAYFFLNKRISPSLRSAAPVQKTSKNSFSTKRYSGTVPNLRETNHVYDDLVYYKIYDMIYDMIHDVTSDMLEYMVFDIIYEMI